MSKNISGQPHPKELKSWDEGRGTKKQQARLARRDARKAAKLVTGTSQPVH